MLHNGFNIKRYVEYNEITNSINLNFYGGDKLINYIMSILNIEFPIIMRQLKYTNSDFALEYHVTEFVYAHSFLSLRLFSTDMCHLCQKCRI